MGILTPYDYRPARSRPLAKAGARFILWHHSGGGHTDAARCVRYLQSSVVSYHFVIGGDGTVIQCVPIERGANHCGPRVKRGKAYNLFHGEPVGNGDCLGVCFVGSDKPTPAALAAAKELQRRLPDLPNLGHFEVCMPRGRKQDPVEGVMQHLRQGTLALDFRMRMSEKTLDALRRSC